MRSKKLLFTLHYITYNRNIEGFYL